MTGFFVFLALWAFKPGSFVPFSILNAWKKVCKVHEHCTQQQNQPASDGYAFFKCTPRDSIARTIGRQIWIKHSHKGIIRRSLQRFILASILIINKIVSEGCIFNCTIDSRPTNSSLLRTPYHCRQEASPGETHKELTEIYSRYYGLSLLWKCRHFHNPQSSFHLFFACYSGHFVQNPDSHTIKRQYYKENKETIL